LSALFKIHDQPAKTCLYPHQIIKFSFDMLPYKIIGRIPPVVDYQVIAFAMPKMGKGQISFSPYYGAQNTIQDIFVQYVINNGTSCLHENSTGLVLGLPVNCFELTCYWQGNPGSIYRQ